MNLFVQGASTSASGSLDLSVNGTPPGTSGAATSAPLFISGGTGYLSGSMNLFIAGPDSDINTAALNLYVGGQNHFLENSLPLYINCVGVTGYLPLFIRGSGFTDGALPLDGSMNLFLQRWPSDWLPLFLMGPGNPVESGVPLYIHGGETQTGNINLCISGVGSSHESLKLYVRGH